MSCPHFLCCAHNLRCWGEFLCHQCFAAATPSSCRHLDNWLARVELLRWGWYFYYFLFINLKSQARYANKLSLVHATDKIMPGAILSAKTTGSDMPLKYALSADVHSIKCKWSKISMIYEGMWKIIRGNYFIFFNFQKAGLFLTSVKNSMCAYYASKDLPWFNILWQCIKATRVCYTFS